MSQKNPARGKHRRLYNITIVLYNYRVIAWRNGLSDHTPRPGSNPAWFRFMMGEVGLGKLGLSDSLGTAVIIDENVAATYLRHSGKVAKS